MKPNIFIISKPVQNGKTTALMNWCKTQPNIAGILTPDVENIRNLYDIASGTYYDFEVKNYKETDVITSIGKFNFYTHAFAQAQQILLQSLTKTFDYVVIDEIGKLEVIQKKGLEPAISTIINEYKSKKVTGKLVLVIRDYLLEECIKKYGLQDSKVIDSPEQIEQKNDLIGLILCGGKSSRMQTDKAFINYHNEPQAYYLFNQINPLCDQVFISCNQNQINQIDEKYLSIIDNIKYENNGPICALLSAMEFKKNKSFLVMACDYPLLTFDEIFQLKQVWKNTNKSVSFYNNETSFREPLLAIYHQNDLPKLVNFFNEGNTSLQHFLNEINAEKLNPITTQNLTSIDTKEAFQNISKLINS